MYFQKNRKLKLLKVDDDTFAELDSISPTGNMIFKLYYSVKQSEVVHRNTLTVNVTVTTRHLEPPSIFNNININNIDASLLVNNILNQTQNAKATIKKRDDFVVVNKKSNILSSINSDTIPALRAKIPNSFIPSLNLPKLNTSQNIKLKQASENLPLLQTLAHSSLTEQNISGSVESVPRIEMLNMIIKDGQDPSTIDRLTHRSIPAQSSLKGLLRPSREPERDFDPKVKLLNFHLFNNNENAFKKTTDELPDDAIVQIVESVTLDEVMVPVVVSIPNDELDSNSRNITQFTVKFELFDSSSCSVVDEITKSLDVSKHLKLYFAPKKAPIVNVSKSRSFNQVNLEIKQVDKGATGIQIFKKNINRSAPFVEDYKLIDTYNLSYLNTIRLTFTDVFDSPTIYRIIPTGKFGSISSEYTNVVVRPPKFKAINSVVINAKNVEKGIELEVNNIPSDCISIEVLSRNKSNFQKTWSSVSGMILIDDQVRSSDHIIVQHNDLTKGKIYEHTVRILYKNGLTELSSVNSVLEYQPLIIGKVDIQISDLIVDSNENQPNVTFNLTSVLIDSDIDIVNRLLNKQEIQQFFSENIKTEREFLQKLIAHNVQRVNISTGEREDFGVITTDFFNDDLLRKNLAIKPLNYDFKYRYEVSTLIRSPETLFKEFEKVKTDQQTKKIYQFKPSKFLHPIALNKGTIVTDKGLQTNYSKDQFSHGHIGAMESFNITFDRTKPRIIKQTASRFNSKLNIITWKLEGRASDVDHFLIVKNVHGVRTIIGKSHSEFEYGNCRYIHPVSSLDEGELNYIITPIYNDYSIGEEKSTNMVVV